MILPIHTYGARALRAKAKPVHKLDESVIRLVMDMFDTMRGAGGIGLAANQVGKLERVIVVDISDIEEREETPTDEPNETRHTASGEPGPEGTRARFESHPPIALINPEVISSEGTLEIEEGCLSIPAVRDLVERAEQIRIRYKDTNFQDAEIDADGLLARVILHEIDHLNGVLFIDHLAPAKRKTHKEQLKKIQRGEFEVDYPVTGAATRVEAE